MRRGTRFGAPAPRVRICRSPGEWQVDDSDWDEIGENARYESLVFAMALSKLGRYDIVRVLGKGAMGTVYEARDPVLDRRVAIKTIAVHGLSAEGVRDYEIRFRTEARSCARLQHPNIVSVYDSGRDGETAYLVMEYVEGQDLKYHLDQGDVFTLDQTLRIMRDLLSALSYAHAHQVVHRDVKPGNLLIEADGRVKLTDFGVARIQDANDATRTRGLMVGTLKYMSPEQVQGQSVDARADLFAAGVVLYQLLTARQPFVGDSEFAIIAQIIGVDPPEPSTTHPALPSAIDGVLARAMAKSREQRYPDAQAFFDALAQACGQAQDRSTAPAALAIGLGSGASRARMSASASGSNGVPTVPTVTQELELVYWKDVRDSDDALDLQGFLDRFPDGIYADLARRRLRQIGVSSVGEQTATRIEPRSAPRQIPPAVVAAEPTVTHPNQSAPADPAVIRKAGTGPRRWVMGIGAAFAVMIALAVTIGGRFDATPAAVQSVAEPAVAQPVVTAIDAQTPATTVRDAKSTVPVQTRTVEPASATSQPLANAIAKTRPAPSPVPPPADRMAGNAAAAAAADTPTARTPGASTAVSSASAVGTTRATTSAAIESQDPAQACNGRVLLGYQICLNEQCALPRFANHPLCEQRRAVELERRQQQLNRN